MPATPHGAYAGAPPPRRHLAALLPEPRLCLSRLGRLGQSPRQWPSPWRSLAAAPVCGLSSLLSRDPRHALAWQARLCRAHRARHRVPGRGFRYPGHRTGLRGGPEYGAAVAGRSVRQVQLDELFALLSAVKDGAVSEAAAIERLERSPPVRQGWLEVLHRLSTTSIYRVEVVGATHRCPTPPLRVSSPLSAFLGQPAAL